VKGSIFIGFYKYNQFWICIISFKKEGKRLPSFYSCTTFLLISLVLPKAISNAIKEIVSGGMKLVSPNTTRDDNVEASSHRMLGV